MSEIAEAERDYNGTFLSGSRSLQPRTGIRPTRRPGSNFGKRIVSQLISFGQKLTRFRDENFHRVKSPVRHLKGSFHNYEFQRILFCVICKTPEIKSGVEI